MSHNYQQTVIDCRQTIIAEQACTNKLELKVVRKKIEVHERLRLNDSDIKRVTNTKSLGIIVDEGLNWERQYKTVYNNSRGGLQSLRRLKSILPQSSLSNVYRALIKVTSGMLI